MRSIKKRLTYLLDTNIVIYLDVAGLLPACGKIAELGLARVAIPGEVKKELDVKGMPCHMQSLISRGMVRIMHAPAIKVVKKRGNGEKHAIAIAQALIAGGQNAVIVTSDKRALTKAEGLGLRGLTVDGFIDQLYRTGVIGQGEKNSALQSLRIRGIIPPCYGPSP